MSWKKNLTIITLLAGSTATAIHLLNKAIYLSATSDNLLNTNESSYYNWRFGNIYYEKQGEGKPLLLIHDLSTYSSSVEWSKIVNKLSKNHTVYSLDLLGCGRSDKPNITYTNYLYVQLITDFIKNVIKDKTDIISTGMSGSFILGACHNDKEIIDRIIMVNPSEISEIAKIPTSRSKILSGLINLPLIGTLLYNLVTKEEDLSSIFIEDYYYNPSKIDITLKRTYYESAHCGNSSSKYLFASTSGKYLTANIPLYLDGLNNSIFIINGKELTGQADYSEEYANILPSIEILNIENSKYLPQIECPEDFVKEINNLLEEV